MGNLIILLPELLILFSLSFFSFFSFLISGFTLASSPSATSSSSSFNVYEISLYNLLVARVNTSAGPSLTINTVSEIYKQFLLGRF